MQELLANPAVRFLLTLVTGRLVDIVLNAPPARGWLDGVSGAENRREHESIVRDYVALGSTLAINFLYRPPEAAFTHCPRDGTLLVPTRIDGRDRPTCAICGFADFFISRM